MSADNFYLIRRHPLGGFAAVMGFASDEDNLDLASSDDVQFTDVDDAVNWAVDQYSEYGVTVHNECSENAPPTVTTVDLFKELHDSLEPRFISKGFCGFSPSRGWLSLVRKIDETLQVNPDYRIVQVKSKFGGLRFYANGLTENEHTFVSEMEELSFHTCEICGTEDDTVTQRSEKYYIETLCERCD